MYYSKAELLEVSIVTIPANGEATMLEQKFYNSLKEDLLSEMKNLIKENMFINKHILEVIEEDDRYVVSFAKGETEEPEEIEEIEEEEIEEEYKEEEEEEEEKDLSEESTEDMEKADKEEEEEKEDKDFNDLIEAFAYILTT
jgi:ABC-type multidrug transport system ATPase subunit